MTARTMTGPVTPAVGSVMLSKSLGLAVWLLSLALAVAGRSPLQEQP